LIKDTAAVFEGKLISVVSKDRDFKLFGQTIHIHGKGCSEHIPIFFRICCECALKPWVHEVPVEIECEGDCGDSKLPSFQDDKEMNIILQALSDLIHHIGLST